MDRCSSAAPNRACSPPHDGGKQPLVSVVVPAFNAEATLIQTLRSVAAQDYRSLEILIVDDGSSDTTAAIAARFCGEEPRARLLRQENSGVASARNLAIARSRGVFVAPIDADDLWHPAKIRRQMEVALAAPRPPGFVYCWFRDLDETGRVWRDGPPLAVEGSAYRRLSFVNFVGNGSVPLFHREAVVALGGYDDRLRRVGAEGCEDLLLQCRLARRFPVRLVPEYLVGYRLTSGSMSTDPERMLRSRREAIRLLAAEGEVPRREWRWNAGAQNLLLAEANLLRGDRGGAVRRLLRAIGQDPARTGLALACRTARRLELGSPRLRAAQLGFGAHDAARPSPVSDRWLRLLARFDQRRLDSLSAAEEAQPPFPGAGL